MSTKQTPKSCSCNACRRGKSSTGQKVMMKSNERAFRHNVKIALKQGKEDISTAPYGSYTD